MVLAGASSSSRAQGATASEGAVFLLLPIGARAVGMGHAVVADRAGTESIWWNPAGLAHSSRYEVALHHSQSIVATGDAVSVVAPVALLGVFAASVDILNFGEEEVTQDPTGPTGKLLPRSFVYVATYATTLGSRMSAGLSYKIVQLRFDCSGLCPEATSVSATTSALDAGVQYDFGTRVPLWVGAAVRNVGVRLQVNDREQADPLPTRIQVGAIYRLAPSDALLRDTEIRLALDVVSSTRETRPSLRSGVELVYEQRYHARAGYVFGEAGGPAIGLGLDAGSLSIDIARVVGGFGINAGEPPTHLSLRYLF